HRIQYTQSRCYRLCNVRPSRGHSVHVQQLSIEFLFRGFGAHRTLHSFPTRRSSDLVTMRDIKSKNVYSRVNSKATTQWRKTESANGVHLEGVASDNRSS